MPANFCEILLDVDLSPLPRGGPEHANTTTTTPAGVEQVNIERPDYISRYVVDYGLLQPSEREYVRAFHILRQGSAQGFRIVAPDPGNSLIKNEKIGTIASGNLNYYLKKTYSDIGNTIVRRIVKPENVELVIGETRILIQSESGLGGVPLYGVGDGFGEEVACDFTTGIITVSSAFATAHNGEDIYWNGSYHLPVRFENDWNEMKHDFNASDWGSVGIRELLPATLGIFT